MRLADDLLARDIKIAEQECRIFQLEADRQFAPLRTKVETLVAQARQIVEAPDDWPYSTAEQAFVAPATAPVAET